MTYRTPQICLLVATLSMLGCAADIAPSGWVDDKSSDGPDYAHPDVIGHQDVQPGSELLDQGLRHTRPQLDFAFVSLRNGISATPYMPTGESEARIYALELDAARAMDVSVRDMSAVLLHVFYRKDDGTLSRCDEAKARVGTAAAEYFTTSMDDPNALDINLAVGVTAPNVASDTVELPLDAGCHFFVVSPRTFEAGCAEDAGGFCEQTFDFAIKESAADEAPDDTNG